MRGKERDQGRCPWPRKGRKGNAGEIIPPAPPCFFQLLVEDGGNAGDIRSPRRRPQAAGIHFRREARRASCRWRDRTACPGLTGGGVTRARENVIIPPAPPWFFQLLVEDGGNAGRGALNGKGRGVTPRPEGSADFVRAAISVQACAAAPACRGRPVFRFAKAPVWLEGISRFLRECVCPKLWKAVVGKEQSCFNDLAGLRSQRNDRLSTLGAPGDIRSPVGGREQAEFTSAVKRNDRRASPASVQRVRG